MEKFLGDNKDMFPCFAGDIETFLSKCKMAHASRVFTLDRRHQRVLTWEDLEAAMILARENAGADSTAKDLPPPHLYT